MNYTIPAVTTDSWNPKNPELTKREDEVLRQIEKKALTRSLAIGGVLIEPITSKGVFFLPTRFLLRLRELCDRLEIPIIADEIMTGAGEPKFFASSTMARLNPTT